MADIDVVPKRSGSRAWIWWVLALIVLGIVLFALMGNRNQNMPNLPVSALPALDALIATA